MGVMVGGRKDIPAGEKVQRNEEHIAADTLSLPAGWHWRLRDSGYMHHVYV